MNSERISLLKQHVEEEPNDPFNHYALALEYRRHNDEAALHHFNYLLLNHPDYLPVYYQLAQLLNDVGQPDKAIEILQQGIVLATQQGQLKTRGELQSMLDELTLD